MTAILKPSFFNLFRELITRSTPRPANTFSSMLMSISPHSTSYFIIMSRISSIKSADSKDSLDNIMLNTGIEILFFLNSHISLHKSSNTYISNLFKKPVRSNTGLYSFASIICPSSVCHVAYASTQRTFDDCIYNIGWYFNTIWFFSITCTDNSSISLSLLI